MWTLAFGHHEDPTPTHGYEPTREAAMAREELAAGVVEADDRGGSCQHFAPSSNAKTARSWRGIFPFTHLAREGRMTVTIGRRELLAALGGAAASWPLAARAQQAVRVRHIGVLLSLEESDPEGKAQLSGFTQGLAELGWIEGRNLRMEIRRGGGDVDRIRTFAKDLVALQPDVIVAQGTPVTAALQRETRTIPIVFVGTLKNSSRQVATNLTG